jgi:hypothetical protein
MVFAKWPPWSFWYYPKVSTFAAILQPELGSVKMAPNAETF